MIYAPRHAPSCAGGALGALFIGLVASNAWEKGFPRWGSLGTSFAFSPEREGMGFLLVWGCM
jgi:hypothetical protein